MRRQLWAGACLVALYATSASAALVHRYSFTTDASDSVGAANGVLVGNGASVSGGQLVLNNEDPNRAGANDFNNGNIPAKGGFLDLPNNLFSQSAASGQYGAVSIEFWVTMDHNYDWAALFSAGNNRSLTDGNSGAPNDDYPYVQIIPRTGDGGAGNDLRVTSNGFAGPEGFVDAPGDGLDLQPGVEEHIIAVFNQSGGLPGTITVYRNGVQYGDVATIAPNLDIAAMATTFPVTTAGDINVWIGRSQWPDSLLDASINEFRIYDHALTLQDAMTSMSAGPGVVGVPEPGTCVLAALGLLGLAVRRR